MFTMRYPIPKRFMWNGKLCQVNQWFGQNKNSLWYGPKGHQGIDFKTNNGYTKYVRHKGGWKLAPEGKTVQEAKGRIPILACHDGTLRTVLYDAKQKMGWGMYVTAEPKDNVQYRTLYWHIETPWGSMRNFRGHVGLIGQLRTLFNGKRVRKGSVIAISGNNGNSSGPHLHLALDKREKVGGRWSKWYRVNPMPYVRDKDVIAQRVTGLTRQWVYEGEDVTEEEAQIIIKSLPKLYD